MMMNNLLEGMPTMSANMPAYCPIKYAHAYVPFQCLTSYYPPLVGLEKGTIFPELDRPYGMDPEYTVDQ